MSDSSKQDRRPPVLLQAHHVEKALSDPNFYNAMPEFAPVRKRADAAMAKSGGCPSCQRRRARTASNQEFVRIMNTLPDSAMQRLKRYLGIERMLVRSVDTSTGMLRYREV